MNKFYRLSAITLLTITFLVVFPVVASAAPLAVRNGADAPFGEYPWMVGIALADVADGYAAQFCGGTLIDSEWVLTAAHCTYDLDEQPFSAASLDIMIGRSQLSSNEGERIRVDQIIRHVDFQDATLGNDIALLHLSQPTAVTPLALGVQNHLVNPQTLGATIIGWGVTSDGSGADTLQEAQVPLVTEGACNEFYGNYGVTILSSMVCAGDGSGQVDACVGDSGGPLLVWQAEQQRWVQTGIISWGAECGTPGAYGVYTNISSFIDWVQQETGLTLAA
ncbi:MAG: serine protease [Caldilineaceae bacterium]|nr:serine protease [Caldilineaceae bacterium]